MKDYHSTKYNRKGRNMEIDNFYIEEGNCECMKNTEMISLIIITIIWNNTCKNTCIDKSRYQK